MVSCYSRAVIELLIAFTYRCVVASVLLVLLVLFVVVPVAAGALAPPERDVAKSDDASSLVEYDLPLSPALAVLPLEPMLTLQTSFQARAPRLDRRLLNTGAQQISWHVIAAAPQIDIEAVHEGAMLATFPDPATQMSALTDWYYRFRINYARPWEQSRYGAEYRYVGSDYTSPEHANLKPDQGLMELWGMWQFGATQLRTSVGQEWNNVDLDPSRSRLTTTRGRMQMEIAIPALPSLVLSYTRGSARSSWTPRGASPQKSWLDTWEATLHYDRPSWQTTLTSTYTRSQDRLPPNRTALYLYHEFSLIYHLTSRIDVTPAMRMSQYRSVTSGVWTDTPETALSLSYQGLFDVLDLTADGAYTHSYSHDGAWDTHTVNTMVSLRWHFDAFRFGPATMVFEVSYVDYTDTNFPTNSFVAFAGGWSVEMTF